MAALRDVCVVGIHGLPTAILKDSSQQLDDSRKQLNKIRECLFASFPELKEEGAYQDYVWIESGNDFFDAYRHLRNGTFGHYFGEKFDKWLNKPNTVPTDKRLVIIAFSGGGAITYTWLADKRANTPRVDTVIAIAAFHKCEAGHFTLEDDPRTPKRRITVNTDIAVKRADIAAQLRNCNGHLLVLLAQNDGTVPRGDAEFTSITNLDEDLVIEREVPGTTHKTVCDDSKTCDYIVDYLKSRLAL